VQSTGLVFEFAIDFSKNSQLVLTGFGSDVIVIPAFHRNKFYFENQIRFLTLQPNIREDRFD